MNGPLEYRTDSASESQIAEHLRVCDADFVPPLGERIEIGAYARKIAGQAVRFEAWSDGTLVGLIAVYCNDRARGIAYVTSVSVLSAWTGRGIAQTLMSRSIEHARAAGMSRMFLEVARDNAPAIRLYESSGFVAEAPRERFVSMSRALN